jgi:1,2-diacylglycerol 3-alpha-glucosyltransferase
MRILMLSHGYPPTISGVTLVVQKVARSMAARGHEVTVVTASDHGTPYQTEDNGVRLWRVRSAPNPFWSEGRLPLLTYDRLKEIVAEVKPDLINTHDSALLSWQLYRLERQKGHVPEVLTCHFLPRFVTYYVHAGDVIEEMVEEITWDFTLRMMSGFDHIIFPTGTQRSLFKKEGLEVPSSVISNGLDIRRYAPQGDDGDLAERYALPPGPRVLFVGRLARDKKIGVLIRSMAAVEDAHLLIVGRGDDRERLGELAREVGVAERVHLLGFVPEQDLPGIYRAADLFAIASDVEVQSIPTLQAAASGLPIVAADAAALPEIVHDDQNGYLVPAGDAPTFAAAMGRILEDHELAERFGQASLRIGLQHSDEHTFQAYERLYRRFIDGENNAVGVPGKG